MSILNFLLVEQTNEYKRIIMWSGLNVKYILFTAVIVILCALSLMPSSSNMHRYGKYTRKAAKFQPAPKHQKKTISKHLLSNLAQYDRRILKLSQEDVTEEKEEHVNMKVPSKFKSKSFKFTLLTNYNYYLHKDSSPCDDFSLLLMVTDKDNKTVKGCSFDAVQIFNNDTPQLKALCTVEDLHNGRYKVLCQKHGKTRCFKLTMSLHSTAITKLSASLRASLSWNHKALQRNFCFPEVSSRVCKAPGESSPSWTLDSHGHCE